MENTIFQSPNGVQYLKRVSIISNCRIELIFTIAKDFIKRMLVVDPKKRYTAEQCLNDPWIKVFIRRDHFIEWK
jgi:serine/threonine protein kinase